MWQRQFGFTISVLTLLSFHCLLRPADARQLRWCDVELLMDPSQHVTENFLASSTSEKPTRRRMARRAAEQHVRLECHGICQLFNTMKSSVPDRRLHKTIWEIADRLRALAVLAPHFFAEQDYSKSVPPANVTSPYSHHRWRSSHRSAQRRRATELCPHRLASLSAIFPTK